MESCDVIAFRDAFIRTSVHTSADVRVTKIPYNDDVDSYTVLPNGHLSDDENLQFVEAVPIAASEFKNTGLHYDAEIRPGSANPSEDSEGGVKQPDRDEEVSTSAGKDPDMGERRSSSGCRERLDCGAGKDRVEPPPLEVVDEVQTSLVEIMERLALTAVDRPSSTKTDPAEESNQTDDDRSGDGSRQQGTADASPGVRARGPTGGLAVAYPANPLNCGWVDQSYPGGKRSQFMTFPDFADFGSDIFIDATLGGAFFAEDDGPLQPTKFRKGPQPVESVDLSPLDYLPFPSLSPKDIAEVLGGDECAEDFFAAETFYNIPEQPQKLKHELERYSPAGNQFRNASVVGELYPSGMSASSPSFLQQLQNDLYHHQQQQQPSCSIVSNPITAASPLSHAQALSSNSSGKFFPPGVSPDPTQFRHGSTMTFNSCAGFPALESTPPGKRFGGSDYSQSPHLSMKGSPGSEDPFSPEPPENLAEIEAILKFINKIENEVQIPDGKQPAITPSANNPFPLDKPPPGNTFPLDKPPPGNTFPLDKPPTGKQQLNHASPSNILPLIDRQPSQQLANPPSESYRFPLENSPVSQTAGQIRHPSYSTATTSFHPVHSSPAHQTQSSMVNIALPPTPAGQLPRSAKRTTTTRDERSAELTTRTTTVTNSGVSDNHLKDQSLSERKQLAKASSVIARLTKQQLVMPDSDLDTLLHLAIAKNERYLTEALICRLDRDKLTNSMINLKNKQGQTPLCLATVTNQWALVNLLVDRGADVNVRIPLGAKQANSFCNPVHFAASNGKEWLRTLEQLLRAKAIDLSALDSEGCSALHKAVMANGLSLFHGRSCEMIDSRESVRQLILHGIDISQQDGLQSKTALNIALERGDLDLFYYILDLASPRVSLPLLLNARTGRRGDTLLHVAAALQTDPTQQLTVVRQMLSRGANPQLRNWDNRLPWELATRPQMAELLQIPAAVGVGS